MLLSLAFFAFSVWWSFDPAIMEEPGLFVMYILLMFILVVIGLILLVTILVGALRLDWRRSVRRTIALVFAVLIVDYSSIAADYIHLIVMYPHYKALIAGRTGPIAFDWGSIRTSSLPMRTDRVLIYDETEATAMKTKETNEETDRTTRLLGYFFLNVQSTS